mmetsp:Transcript_61498/g.170520  ORF Transcript_61498/g.170520 Transcript_61498/m.170520 type:complete len:418 (-) Transcript_61498:52-1305(-)
MASQVEVGAFVKYDKMGEDSGSVGASASSASSNQYLVTEKVHGANFCLIARLGQAGLAGPAEVRFAKRTAILGSAEDAEDFYSCRSAGLLRRLGTCAEAVLRRVAQDGAPSGGAGEASLAVHIYGELFGGDYPHPDVKAVEGLQPVQVGVWYSPALQFMGFDVAVETGLGRCFLDFDAARAHCEGCGLLFAEPLFRGSLSECLDFPIEFETTVPARLGLPALPSSAATGRNVAEGVVVRPCREPRGAGGGAGAPAVPAARAGKESARGLFKRKIEAFSEKRYQNDDWRRGKAGGAGAAPALSEEDLALIEIQAAVTEQRLANVLSKVGRVDPLDQRACRRLLDDFKADVAESLEDADERLLSQSTALQEQLDQLCRDMIKQDFVRRGLLPSRRAGADRSAALLGAATPEVVVKGSGP